MPTDDFLAVRNFNCGLTRSAKRTAREQANIVESWAERCGRSREPHNETRGFLCHAGRNRILYIVESIAIHTFCRSGNGYVGQGLSVNG